MMAGLRFKLDLVSFDDPATLLQLPVSAAPSSTKPLQHIDDEADADMAKDTQLVEQLVAELTSTDISYVLPVHTDVAPNPLPPCALAKALLCRNPLLFQYGVADMEGVEAGGAAATPTGHRTSSSMAISAHNTQLEPAATTSARKGGAEATGRARAERGAATDAPTSKKRQRREARQEVYVLLNDEAEAAAAKLSHFIESCIAAASSRAPDADSDEEEGAHDDMEGGDGRGGRRDTRQPRRIFRLEALKDLHTRLLTAQAQGYLYLVPQAQLHSLLLALHSTAETGRNQLLSEAAEAKSAAVARVSTALEAMLCELVVYSTPGLPPALYLDELLGCAAELSKYHLQYNVLPLHDARFKRMYRPSGGDEDDAEEAPAKAARPPRGRGAGASAAGRHSTPRWTSMLVGQLEQALALLGQVMGLVRIGAEGLIPLVRMSQQTLTVGALQTLHYRALGLAVSMFKYCPQQRSTVLDEFVQGVLTHLGPGKHLARHFPLQTPDRTSNVQMATALVMQLIQVTAELPPVDATGPNALDSARLPIRWSDYFWREVFKRLSSNRASKADTSTDLKAWLEALVEDLLVALPLPEWPAAGCLLRRLILIIHESLTGSDAATAAVHPVCIELLGLMTRSLYVLAKEAAAPEVVRTVDAAVEEAAAAVGRSAAEAVTDKHELLHELLLARLAAESSQEAGANGGGAAGAATSIERSARQLIACNLLLAREKGQKLDEQQAEDAVVYYRQVYERQRSCLGTSTSGLPALDREKAVVVGRWLVAESILGCSRTRLLKWLADAGGSGRTRQEAHAANVRAKAIKLMSGAIEVDVRLLNLPEVQAGIQAALGDDSALVRDAAIELVGKYISRNADVASQFYDILARAAQDQGAVSVRKRAIRLLWECCARWPDFTHRNDAMLRIMAHAADQEETMRSLVTKICAEVFFLSHFQLETDDGNSTVSRGADQRASQLGEVVMAEYSRMGSATSIPFHSAQPIVVTIRSIVGEEGKPECETVRRGAREVADALLARALELQGEQDSMPTKPGTSSGSGSGQAPGQQAAQAAELFRCLLALHVLCVADAKLLHRPEDPQRVIRCLAPYIKEIPLTPNNDLAGRRKAEQLLAVLAVLGGCMGAVRHIDDDLANEIVQDLKIIIARGFQVQAVTVACQCLCTMASLQPRHRETVRLEAADYFTWLKNDVDAQVTGLPDRQRRYPRFLFSLGTLCRYGADILDQTPGEPTCASALSLVLQFYNLMEENIKAKDTALQALGFIFIAQPQLAVSVREVADVLGAALDGSAPATIKARCLGSLTELLRSEEDVLLGAQAAARQEAAAAQQATTLPGEESRALARRNGEGDSSSVSSGIIQMLWDKILALATDTTPASAPVPATSGQTPPPTPSGTASAHGAVVRRRALDLIQVVIRGGIVVPWTAMPALCALATDPDRDTAARALASLRDVVAANTAFVAGQVPGGVAEAYAFHCKLAALGQPGQRPAPDKYRTLVEGLSGVWATIFQPDKALKAKFLAALLKPLDDACTLASNLAAKSDPHLLSFMTYIIAELPYRKMDELLGVLVRVNDIISRRAAEVLNRFQELREEARTGPAAATSKSGHANGNATGYSHVNGDGHADGAPPASPLPSVRSTPGAASSAAAGLPGVVKASVALSLLLLLKQYLRMSYDVTADRVAKFQDPQLQATQRKTEEKLVAVHNGKLRFNAAKLKVDLAARTAPAAPLQGAAGAASSSRVAKAAAGLAAAGAGVGGGPVSVLEPGVDEVYRVLKNLLKQDEAEYKPSALGSAADAEATADSSPAGAGGDLRDVTVNLAEMMAAPDSAARPSKKPPLAARGRSRGGSRGRATPAGRESTGGRGRGRPPPSGGAGGRGSTAAKRRGGGKRKRIGDDDEDSDGGGDTDSDDAEEEEEKKYKPRATKRRLEKAL